MTWHNRAVLTSYTGFGRKVQKWDQLDPNLKSYAHMAVAALVGCSFGKSPAAVCQIAHRARDHVATRRQRMPVSMTEQQEAVDRFLAAIRHGDLQGLLDVLAPDVVLVSAGGGLVAAARRPIDGAERVAGFIIGAARSVDFEAKAVWLNGSPAGRVDIGGELDTAVSVAVENGQITHIYAIRNPHKLARLDGVAALTRT
ncbi:MAG: hypothetical protein KY438_02770 [Actinobacteria bacterium]|nr:hypothetical protein [Actinomycetota bacterium]